MNFIYTLFGTPLGWIMWLCFKIIPVYGVALLLFTVIVRAALVPLAVKQQKSMVKMQIFQPRMAEMQKKYANNKEKLNEEMMKLYQEEGYNPMSGCLPMLIQMPILFGLYDVVQKPLTHLLHMGKDLIAAAVPIAENVLGTPGALTNNYTAEIRIVGAVNQNPAAFDSLGSVVQDIQNMHLSIFGIDLTQTPSEHIGFTLVMLVPILSLLTSFLVSFISMRQSSQTAGASMNGMTKGMMLFMPLMSGYLAFVVPAGLGFYWIMSNVLSGVQTVLLNKYMNPKEMAEKAQAEYEAKRAAQRQEKIEAKKKAKQGELDISKALSQKEINRMKLAAARKRDAEKYGEEYIEVTDDDLK